MSRTSFSLRDFVISILASLILLTGCGRRTMEGIIIITEAAEIKGEPDFITGELWSYFPEAHLIAIDPSNPDIDPKDITPEFHSAKSPEISYDGTHLLFAGQINKTDAWQIWEMNIRSKKTRQITDSKDNSIDPSYLPGGSIVFSRYSEGDSLKAGHSMFTCKLDGTDLKRITFDPGSYFASSVLKDGRITAVRRQIYPEKGKPSIMVLRPDGTKSELFYRGDEFSQPASPICETDNGLIAFIEKVNPDSPDGKLVSINYNRPLHSRRDLSASVPGDYRSVSLLKNGKLMVSYRSSGSDNFSLYEFDADKGVLGRQIYKNASRNVIEAAEVYVHERPRKLPSEVDMGVKTGLLLCQNINVTGMSSPTGKYSLHAADRIELIGIDSSLGVVKVEEDGSFYLKVTADMPFRIRTLDSEGKTVNGPGSWYWLRPNERRGCVGCHEDNEIVPANRYAVAVSKQPVIVPVHITNIKEKEVELE